MNRKIAGLTGAAVAGVGIAALIAVNPIAGAEPQADSPMAPPSAADLNLKVNTVMDPAVQSRARTASLDVVEGEGHDPHLYDERAIAAGLPVITFEIDRVEMTGEDTAMAVGLQYANGKAFSQENKVPFVRDGSEWKISREFICALTAPPPGQPTQEGCE